MTTWRLQSEECPFKITSGPDKCEFRHVYNYIIENGEFKTTGQDPTKYWCNGPNCAMAAIGRSVGTHELWKAYQDHRLRFMVDGKGNPVIKITNTGEVVKSQDFTTEHLERARHDAPSPRDHTGRLKPGVIRKRLRH